MTDGITIISPVVVVKIIIIVIIIKAMAWDVTVASTLTDSYVGTSSTSSVAAAEQAAYRKSMKYADLPSYLFPVSAHSGGDINDSTTDFSDRLGQMISAKTNEV